MRRGSRGFRAAWCPHPRWSGAGRRTYAAPFLLGCSPVEVGSRTGTGGRFPSPAGPVAGGVELVVVEGGAGAPVPGDGAAAGEGGGGALGAGACGGAFVPPGVVQAGDRVAELGGDGAGVAADEFLDGG